MAPLMGPHNESYEEFYDNWTRRQEELFQELADDLESNMTEPELNQLVKKVEKHYEFYYEVKDNAARQNILKVVIPSWRSPLENAFSWLGGWRPSTAFQLVYALAGQQIEAELAEFLEGMDTPTFASLLAAQLAQVSDLQILTCKQEESLSAEMATLQQSLGDQPLLTLAQVGNAVSHNEEAFDDTSGSGDQGAGVPEDMDNQVQAKLKVLEDIAIRADALRQSTLKKVLELLDTVQKAQFLIAAASLQISIRNLGQKLNDDTV